MPVAPAADETAESFAVDLARRAGDLMRASFATSGARKVFKSDNSPLTLTDTAINQMVIESIREQYPTCSVIGEEESHGDHAASEWTWVCDPIDGTTPFSTGYPTFAFSLGLTHQGVSVLGVVYDPMLDRMVTARKGNGAFLNGRPIRVGRYDSFRETVVDLEFPAMQFDGGSVRTALRAQRATVVSLWSVVYGGMLVAIGEMGAACYGAVYPWDGCALDVIVKEAGGRMTDFRGNDLRFDGRIDGFVASNAILHDELLDLIAVEYPPG